MLTQFLGIGGLERMIYNLALSLEKNSDWKSYVFAYDQVYQDQMASMDEAFVKAGVSISGCRKPEGFSWAAVEKIARYVRENDISVIHSHDLGALIYGVLAKIRLFGRVKLIHTQHSFVHFDKNKRYNFYGKWFTKLADRVVAVSNDTRQTYKDLGVTKQAIDVIQNGVDFSDAPVTEKNARDRMRAKLIEQESAFALKPFQDSIWILYLARVHGGKGQPEAIQLWNALSEEDRKKAVMVFVGPDTQPGALDALLKAMKSAKTPERVIYAGPTGIPRRWIEASDLFLSSSLFEGMPLAPNEAAGSGVPVVLSDIPGHENLKNFAKLYPLDRPELGAKAVSEVMSEIEKDYSGFFAKQWKDSQPIRDVLSVRAMALEYAKVYR